jgi:hypothetical protein
LPWSAAHVACSLIRPKSQIPNIGHDGTLSIGNFMLMMEQPKNLEFEPVHPKNVLLASVEHGIFCLLNLIRNFEIFIGIFLALAHKFYIFSLKSVGCLVCWSPLLILSRKSPEFKPQTGQKRRAKNQSSTRRSEIRIKFFTDSIRKTTETSGLNFPRDFERSKLRVFSGEKKLLCSRAREYFHHIPH